LSNAHHLPNETVLWWCPKQHVFVAPTHGETFDRSGAAIGGPATAGLDRFATKVHGVVVETDYDTLIRDLRLLCRGPEGLSPSPTSCRSTATRGCSRQSSSLPGDRVETACGSRRVSATRFRNGHGRRTPAPSSQFWCVSGYGFGQCHVRRA